MKVAHKGNLMTEARREKENSCVRMWMSVVHVYICIRSHLFTFFCALPDVCSFHFVYLMLIYSVYNEALLCLFIIFK